MKFKRFKVENYRNVIDSGWINVNQITAFVGQNEAGKSNLFEALYCLNPFIQDDDYDIDEDWPVDKWSEKDNKALVCHADFALDEAEISSLFDYALATTEEDNSQEDEDEEAEEDNETQPSFPKEVLLSLWRGYGQISGSSVSCEGGDNLDTEKIEEWAKENLPKFVYIRDYELSGTQIELDQLASRLKKPGWPHLSTDEQTISIVLELAKIDIDDFLGKGGTAEGRTIRSFDKVSASSYLSKQFKELWKQKAVKFNIEIDATTLNIFAEDEGVGMPVRLHRRSTGFRWHVSFAWKFTHASQGQYKGCILLLEEPGIHLHFDGQRDVLQVFEKLSENNTILYTTHLASMVDLAYPERVRIVEVRDHHTTVIHGVVSTQQEPMAVIESCLNLTGNMSGLLGNRQTLIVEGGTDHLILQKLSGVLRNSNKDYLSDRIFLWPAKGAPKTPMYAAFAIGQNWNSGVLLDSDSAGQIAKEKINKLFLKKIADANEISFRVLMINEAAGIKKTDSAIEDLFPDDFYIECVNKAYGINISEADLPEDGSDMITKRVETILKDRHKRSELDKSLVLGEMLKQFDTWDRDSDLPEGTAERAEKLFKAINKSFEK